MLGRGFRLRPGVQLRARLWSVATGGVQIGPRTGATGWQKNYSVIVELHPGFGDNLLGNTTFVEFIL